MQRSRTRSAWRRHRGVGILGDFRDGTTPCNARGLAQHGGGTGGWGYWEIFEMVGMVHLHATLEDSLSMEAAQGDGDTWGFSIGDKSVNLSEGVTVVKKNSGNFFMLSFYA